MTDTIPNVPRELKPVLAMILNALDRDAADGKQARAEMAAELRALLSAPSPAGVDGLEVRAYEDSGGALYTAKLLEIMAVDSAGCEPLCRLSDAKAIIEGLRGEVADLLSMLTTVSKAGLRVRTERDQQAQRIGELVEVLRIAGGAIKEICTERNVPLPSSTLRRIDAALSAGKDSDQ